jgi:DNA polymerase-1
VLTVIKDTDKVDWANMKLSEMLLGNAYDTDFTYRLHKILTKAKEQDYHRLAYDKIMSKALPIYAKMGMDGVRVDKDRLNTVKKNLEDAINELKDRLLVDTPGLNLNSDVQIMCRLFTDEFEYTIEKEVLKKYKNGKEKMVKRKEKVKSKGFDLSPEKDHLTDAGNPSTNKEAIAAYIWQVTNKRKNPEAENFLRDLKEYKRLQKLKSAFVDSIERALENTGDRMYFNYKLDGTVTGRLSCSKASKGRKKEDSLGVSFHTLPREKDEHYNVRDSFVVDDYETQSFVAIDYSTMELRILAHCSQDPAMMQAFIEGKDLHTYTASLVYNTPMEEIPKDSPLRQNSKTINFLKVYGGGITKLMHSCELSHDQAKFIDQRHKEIYSTAYAWMDSMDRFIKDNRRSVSIFGRSRRLPDVASRHSNIVHSCLRKGKNAIIQSSASDVLVCATIEIEEFIRENEIPNTRILANVHDSIELAVDKRILMPFLKEVKRIMLKPRLLSEFGIELSVPLEIEAEVGTSFGDAEVIEI